MGTCGESSLSFKWAICSQLAPTFSVVSPPESPAPTLGCIAAGVASFTGRFYR